ncbi:hypothetical protein [Sphingomonas sp. UYEF23]|uniref:hypothetical protein n=1 Tax=Sphingomonas sp. UYEF23 TaxID=1756408 RepID=UPI0033958C9C
MSRLRVRLVLNEGGEGAPLGQIIDISREFERFLRLLAEDSGIAVNRRDWVARKFENKSVRFDVEAPTGSDETAIEEFNSKFAAVDSFDPAAQKLPTGVRFATVLQYAKAAEALAAHENVSFGLYRSDGDKPFTYKRLSKLRANELQQRLNEKLVFKTTVQGIMHNVGIEEHYFQLRERKSQRLLRCDFPAALYDEVHAAAALPETLVYVRGHVSERRVDRFVESVKVEKVRAAPAIPDLLGKLFGHVPDYTQGMSTEEFTESSWGEDE